MMGVKRKIDKIQELQNNKKKLTDSMAAVQDVVKNMPSVRVAEANIAAFLIALEQNPIRAFKQLAKGRTKDEIQAILVMIKKEAGGSTEEKLANAALVLMGCVPVQNEVSNLTKVLDSCKEAVIYGFGKANESSNFNLGSLRVVLESIDDEIDAYM